VTKKTRKASLLKILFLAGMVLSCALSIGVTLATFAETYTLLSNGVFTYTVPNTDSQVVLRCYPISGDAGSVGVVWGEADPLSTPSTIEIPSRVYDEHDNPYVVKVIGKSGFRYCDFETITLPSTIQEIQTEAFYCCMNLTEIVLPYALTAIAPSTFMDCRSLTKVAYSTPTYDGNDPVLDEFGDPVCEETNVNESITVIGDHAFTSCVKLKAFDCPRPSGANATLTIEDSAFQNCKAMMSFFFPNQSNLTISVGKYAFADCAALTVCYFTDNIASFGEHAFAKCESLTLYYAKANPGSFPVGFDANWRKKHPATDKTAEGDYVRILYNSGDLEDSASYPGLYYTVKTGPIKLDSTTKSGNQIPTIDTSTDKYISIFKFETPTTADSSYYNTATNQLILPDEIKAKDGKTYPVKVIQSNAFLDNTTLAGVNFNPRLVQIRSQAFYGCSGISSLSFERCTNLIEISHEIFQGPNTNTTPANASLDELRLPACLKYIGYRAFYNFTKVGTFAFKTSADETASRSISVEYIGESAFENLGSSYNGTKKDFVLPNTLGDKSATDNSPKTATSNLGKFAVQKAAFRNAKLFKTITMEPIASPVEQASIADYRISLGASAFENCSNVTSFTGNKYHHMIGAYCFKGCSSLREMFLSTYASETSDKTFPWGVHEKGDNTFGAPIFGSDSSIVDLVIYVDGASAPKSNATQSGGNRWNSETSTFLNDYSTDRKEHYLCRENIPTYYDVSPDEVKYIDLSTSSVIDSTDFNTNVIAFIIDGGNYLLTRCYVKSDVTSIDLSQIKDNLSDETATASAKIKIIGAGAFGKDSGGKIPGTKFKLPSGLLEIRDRAFFRKTANQGVLSLTYDGGGALTDGVCELPTGLNRLERLSFYNCQFVTIKLPTAMDFFGNTAFVRFPGKTSTSSNALNTTLLANTVASGSDEFAVSNNGLYYVGSASPKTLLYQASKGSGDNPSLSLSSDVIALGVRSLADTNYKTINLPSSLTTIYGGALEHNKVLNTVTGGAGLKYIAAASVSSHTSDTDVWNNNAHFDIKDAAPTASAGELSWISTFGAFGFCTSLETFDFTKLTNLRKIGYGAFQGCSALKYMTPYESAADQYTYFKYTSGKLSESNVVKDLWKAPTNNEGVLDLTPCTELESIGRYAFGLCSQIEFVHLPESGKLYIREDNDTTDDQPGTACVFADTKVSKNSNKGCILIGENAASASYKLVQNCRYPAAALVQSNVDTRLYFQVKTLSDVINGNSSLRYWMDLGNHEYLLFENETKIKAYLS